LSGRDRGLPVPVTTPVIESGTVARLRCEDACLPAGLNRCLTCPGPP